MFLLYTNVVSELRKVRTGKADTNVVRWAESLDTASLFISAITVHELEVGILLSEWRDPAQGGMPIWLETSVLPAFEGRILPVDVAVGRRAAKWHVHP
jgi:predicted nucleic acid-binding protein